MCRQTLERELGYKTYNISEFAEALGVTHQLLSRAFNQQLKGKVARYPLPNPVGKIGRSSLWTEAQVTTYKELYRQQYRFHVRKMEDGSEVYGKNCSMCEKFLSYENYYYFSSTGLRDSMCKMCCRLKEAEDKRKAGKVVRPYKPRPLIVRIKAEDGKFICPCCSKPKESQEFLRGRTKTLERSICNDCENVKRRERYAIAKGKVLV